MTFMLWLSLYCIYIAAMTRYVPHRTLLYYQQCPKSRENRALLTLWYALPLLMLAHPLSLNHPAMAACGAVVFSIGSALLAWSFRSNPYFQPAIEQPPRMITSGPYAHLRHPGYAGMVGQAAGMALLAARPAAVLLASAYIAIILKRAREENALLYSASA